jgi:hypothetical protein
MAPVAVERKKEKFNLPNQQSVTAKATFPNPQKLMSPPTKGTLDVKKIISQQSPETRARISVESSGNPAAVSKKGAQGLSQLMPGTAQDIARDLNETYTPLRPGMTPEQQAASIDQNVRFGDYYLKKMKKEFGGNQTLAWAAYNAGPQRVKDAMKLAGTSTDTNKILSALPEGVRKETLPYVDKVSQILSTMNF